MRSKKESARKIRSQITRFDFEAVVKQNDDTLSIINRMSETLVFQTAEQTDLMKKMVERLEFLPRNALSLEQQRREMFGYFAKLTSTMEQQLKKETDPSRRSAIAAQIATARNEGTRIATPENVPRNLKEVFAKRTLGLDPSKVREQGIFKAFGGAVKGDVKTLFGNNSSGKQIFESQVDAENTIAERHEQRRTEYLERENAKLAERKEQAHEEALKQAPAQEKKIANEKEYSEKVRVQRNQRNRVGTAHEEAFEINERADKLRMEEAHGEALNTPEREQLSREQAESLASTINDRADLISDGSPQVSIADSAEEKKDTQKTKTTRSAQASQEAGKWAKNIFEEVKGIRALIEKGDFGGSDGEGSPTKKKRGKGKFDEREDADTEEMDKLHDFALLYNKVVDKQRGVVEKEEKLLTSKEDEENAILDAIQEENDILSEIQKDKYEEGDFGERGKEEEERQLAEKNKWDVVKSHNEALREDDNRTRGAKYKNEAHQEDERQARDINDRADRLEKEKKFSEAKLSAQDQAIQEDKDRVIKAQLVEPAPTFIEDEKDEKDDGNNTAIPLGTPNLLTRGMGAVRGLAALGSTSVGAAGAGTIGATVVGGLAAGYGIGKAGLWGAKKLGFDTRSEGEKLNEEIEERASHEEEQAEQMAKERGYNSFKEMQQANKINAAQKAIGGETSRPSITPTTPRIEIPHKNIGSAMDAIIDKDIPDAPVTTINNYNSEATKSSAKKSAPSVRDTNPSFIRFQDKRLSRVLF